MHHKAWPWLPWRHVVIDNCLAVKDHWGDDIGLLHDGAKFFADYLGSTLVEELDEGQSYGNKISAKAVKSIHDMVGLLL